jgi:hypothetical protein
VVAVISFTTLIADNQDMEKRPQAGEVGTGEVAVHGARQGRVTMLGSKAGTGVTARCPVPGCRRPIRSWRLWRRQPAERAADVDIYFPVLGEFAAFVSARDWDPVDLAVFAAWGQWARAMLHDWAHGDRDARSPLLTEASLVTWCTKAQGIWEALAEVDPTWCADYAVAVRHGTLALPHQVHGEALALAG